MTPLRLHLVSDSTGETLESVVKAALAQFEGVDPIRHFWPLVRSEGHLDRVLDEIARMPGLVLFTLVEPRVRARLEARCAALGLPVIAALDPVMDGLSRALGRRAKAEPGGQHALDDAYFRRIEAINWTMDHDDGLLIEDWHEADLILLGVSRTSKTPTSMYLANRGLKVANLPLVPGRPAPHALVELRKPLIIGLTVHPDRLAAVRRARLATTGGTGQAFGDAYVAPAAIEAELNEARRLFADHGWPVIDVTRRSIEETAAAILHHVSLRQMAAQPPSTSLSSLSATRP